MRKEIMELAKAVKTNGGHVFYPFDDEEAYIDNILTYISIALDEGSHIMIIENDRIMPQIEKKISQTYKQEQIEMIHPINNYDFYCYRGNFHKDTILSYLKNMVNPYLEKKIPIMTWAHVEWRDQDEIYQTLGEYEHEADKMLSGTDSVTVCAYDANRVPPSLKETLLDCHDYFMTDGKIKVIDRNKATAE